VLATGDEPLDAVQRALVRMWVGIIGRRIRARLAAEAAAIVGEHDVRATDQTGDRQNDTGETTTSRPRH